MAYEKINWKNHIVEFPFRRQIEDNQDGTYDVRPDVGEILQVGTKQSAENFNHMEDGIADLDSRINQIEINTQNLTELENDEIDEIFEMAGSVSPGGYPEDWEEATTDDIDSLFE